MVEGAERHFRARHGKDMKGFIAAVLPRVPDLVAANLKNPDPALRCPMDEESAVAGNRPA